MTDDKPKRETPFTVTFKSLEHALALQRAVDYFHSNLQVRASYDLLYGGPPSTLVTVDRYVPTTSKQVDEACSAIAMAMADMRRPLLSTADVRRLKGKTPDERVMIANVAEITARAGLEVEVGHPINSGALVCPSCDAPANKATDALTTEVAWCCSECGYRFTAAP